MKFLSLAAMCAAACTGTAAGQTLSANIPNPVAIPGILGNKLQQNKESVVAVAANVADLTTFGPVRVMATITTGSDRILWLDDGSSAANSSVAVLTEQLTYIEFNFTTINIGSVTIEFKAYNGTTGAPSEFYLPPDAQDLTVIKSYAVEDLSQAFGWIYFAAWGFSFLPQLWENFRNKSVVGLNFDFVVLNLVAFACYAVYYLLFYFDPAVQHAYHETIDPGSLPIAINDLCFALWAFILCALTAVQVFIYERGDQRISYFAKGLVAVVVVVIIIFAGLAGANTVSMLTFAYALSYVKVGITFVKLVPQVYQNFKRKQTTGMSIYQWWLDFAGGFFSLAQQLTDGANAGDWIGLFGNAPKTLLAFEALIFDVILFIQHYALYRENNKRAAAKQGYTVQSLERHRLLGEDEGVI